MSDYAKNTVKYILDQTTASLTATDYTYMKTGGEENPNVAVRANYQTDVEESPYDNGIYIVHSEVGGDNTRIPRFPMNTVVMGINRAGSKTIAQADATINYAKNALKYVSEKRSVYGAIENRLEHTMRNNANAEENTTAAESRIRDTDMATEMVAFSNQSIIAQAGTSMLAQANQQPQNVLSLIGQ